MAKSECTPIKKHYIIAFFISLFVAAGLIISSFVIPPEGEIHPSVLKGVGELFLWPSLAFAAKAVEEGRSAKITHGKTTFVVGKDEHPHHPEPDWNNDNTIEEDEHKELYT